MFDIKVTETDEYVEALLMVLWWSQPRLKFARYKYTLSELRDFINLLASTRIKKIDMRTNKLRPIEDIPFVHAPNETLYRCVVPSCPPGFQPIHEVFTTASWRKNYEWHCVKCSVNYFKNNSGQHLCTKCLNDTIPNNARTLCFDPYEEQFFSMKNRSAIIVLCVIAIGLAFNGFALYVFISKRNSPTARASYVASSISHLGLHMTLFIVLPLLFIGRPTLVVCIARPTVTGFLLTTTTAITLKKTQQLLYAFQANQKLTRENIFMTEAIEFLILFLLVALQVILSATFFMVTKPKVVVDVNRHTYIKDVKCNTDLHLDVQLTYILLLSVFCVIQGFRARKLPKYFNDTKYIGFSMFITVILLLLKVPVYYSYTESMYKTFLNMLVISLINLSQLVVMHAHKIYSILNSFNRKSKEFVQLGILQRPHELGSDCN